MGIDLNITVIRVLDLNDSVSIGTTEAKRILEILSAILCQHRPNYSQCLLDAQEHLAKAAIRLVSGIC